MPTPAEKLRAITDKTPTTIVAMMIADTMVFYAKSEWYRYRINHDISPPKCLACPLAYDWAMKGYVGIETTNKAHARQWLTQAALAGYKIQEVDAKRKPLLGEWIESIDNARMRAEYFRRPKPEIDDDDDDIPF